MVMDPNAPHPVPGADPNGAIRRSRTQPISPFLRWTAGSKRSQSLKGLKKPDGPNPTHPSAVNGNPDGTCVVM